MAMAVVGGRPALVYTKPRPEGQRAGDPQAHIPKGPDGKPDPAVIKKINEELGIKVSADGDLTQDMSLEAQERRNSLLASQISFFRGPAPMFLEKLATGEWKESEVNPVFPRKLPREAVTYRDNNANGVEYSAIADADGEPVLQYNTFCFRRCSGQWESQKAGLGGKEAAEVAGKRTTISYDWDTFAIRGRTEISPGKWTEWTVQSAKQLRMVGSMTLFELDGRVAILGVTDTGGGSQLVLVRETGSAPRSAAP